MSRFLLLVVSTVLSLALCEAAVRALNLGPEIAAVDAWGFRLSPNPVLQYELQPGSHSGGVHINDDGMRDRPFPLAKPAGTFRIAVIGDSIAYGFNVDDEQTFPKVLETLLRSYLGNEGTAFEVLNFGVIGYSVPEVVESLRVKALRYEPDLVIYGYCLNDPELYNPFARMLRHKLEGRQRGYLDRLAAGHLRIYALARYAWDSYRRQDPVELDEDAIWNDDPGYVAIHAGARVYESYITRLHDAEGSWGALTGGLDGLGSVARERGVPVAVAVFPLMRRLEPYTLGPVHRKIERAAEERGLLALDLTPAFVAAGADPRTRRKLGLDRVHPSATGHGIAALAILYWLLDEGLVPGAHAAAHDRLLLEEPVAETVRTAMSPAG